MCAAKGNPLNYPFVHDSRPILVDTYRHRWVICRETGNAYSIKKKASALERLARMIKGKKGPYAIYDYFTSPSHIQWSLEESQKVIRDIFSAHRIDPKGKRILDISGGNGHVADELRKLGAEVVLTEVNDRTIEYAKDVLHIETYKFDFQPDSIRSVVKGKFDIILLRAAMMFCLDLDRFLVDLEAVMQPGAIVAMQYCVVPTLGVLLRTQKDEYSYLALYQPETIIDACEKHGLKLLYREDEIDRDMYVYDHDYNDRLTLLRMYFEFKALHAIPFESEYPFRARDRRRTNLILRYEAGTERGPK